MSDELKTTALRGKEIKKLARVKAAIDMKPVLKWSLGVVVYVYRFNPEWCEVEFGEGRVLTCHRDDLEAV